MKRKKTKIASQSVVDYEKHVKDVEQILANHPNELKFYQELTPEYRRDWARHIFSAKQEKTLQIRQDQMVDILSKGYKTIDLYRMNKK